MERLYPCDSQKEADQPPRPGHVFGKVLIHLRRLRLRAWCVGTGEPRGFGGAFWSGVPLLLAIAREVASDLK